MVTILKFNIKDTAANNGMLSLLETVNIPVGVKTVAASASAAVFRIFLMPVDALKTTLQVEGAAGVKTLSNKVIYYYIK